MANINTIIDNIQVDCDGNEIINAIFKANGSTPTEEMPCEAVTERLPIEERTELEPYAKMLAIIDEIDNMTPSAADELISYMRIYVHAYDNHYSIPSVKE